MRRSVGVARVRNDISVFYVISDLTVFLRLGGLEDLGELGMQESDRGRDHCYGWRDPDEDCDLFRGKGRVKVALYKSSLPQHTREAVLRQWTKSRNRSRHWKSN